MTSPITLYGIPNCDTVKKARTWLTEHQLPYTFHDFKKQGIDANLLEAWFKSVGSDRLINRQGTTWKKLTPQTQSLCADLNTAIPVIQANPSIIKRPVLVTGDQVLVGFKQGNYDFLLP